jgi:hypothetical protein
MRMVCGSIWESFVLPLCWGAVAQSKDRMMHVCCLGMSECIERGIIYLGLMVGQKYWNSILGTREEYDSKQLQNTL